MPVARRGFLRTVAALPLALAEEPGLAPAALDPRAAPPAALPGEKDAVAEALAQAVKAEFGAHLDGPGLEAVRKEIAKGLARAERLRQQARLGNADEPVTRFEARPPQRRGGAR
jgi:hypothetical protein